MHKVVSFSGVICQVFEVNLGQVTLQYVQSLHPEVPGTGDEMAMDQKIFYFKSKTLNPIVDFYK